MAQSTFVDLTAIQVSIGGSGSLTLGAAASARRGIEALSDGATYDYSIEQGEAFETGQCVWLAATSQITRTPRWSSNGNGPINVAAGSVVNFTALAASLVAGSGNVTAFANELAGTTGAAQVGTSSGSTIEQEFTDLKSGATVFELLDEATGAVVAGYLGLSGGVVVFVPV